MSGFSQPFDFLVEAAERAPKAVAISTPDVDMTFEDLLDGSRRLALLMRQAGVRPGEVVATAAPTLVELISCFACFHEGVTGTVLPSGYLDDGPGIIDWILTDREAERFPRERQIIINDDAWQRMARMPAEVEPRGYDTERDLCRVVFSSGTTGRPKAVPLSVCTLIDRCRTRVDQWVLESPHFCCLGFSTTMGFQTFVAMVIKGHTYISPHQGNDVLSQIDRHRPVSLIGSPHQLGIILEAAQKSGLSESSLATVAAIGAYLPDFLARQLSTRFGADIVVMYASSECASISQRRGFESDEGDVGPLVPGADVRIVDTDGHDVADGLVGEIAVYRPDQPTAYLGDAKATERHFRAGYFYPGDTGLLRDGRLFLRGRASEIINAAGIKVDPARVEDVALQFPGVSEAAVFGMSDTRGLDVVVLAFVSEDVPNLGELMGFLRARLGDSAPTRIARVAHIPRTATGKVRRDELSGLFAGGIPGI